MSQTCRNSDSTPHNKWLAGYGFLTFAATLVLLYAGGFTTTIGAGMVFPDWPLSNGSLNPPGWTTDQAMLAEHGHRLMGGTVGLLCIGLVIFTHSVPSRTWLRRASWLALGFVVFQGLLGGLRVLLVNLDIATVHGVTAQIFLCLLVSLAVGCSAWWQRIEVPETESDQKSWQGFRIVGSALCLLVMLQLVIGAVMRHRGAGLAVPHFPQATADGAWLPTVWNWATQIHMAHRFGAVLIYAVLLIWLFRIFRHANIPTAAKRLGWAALALVHVQILLGAAVIWNLRQPIETTLHVLNGAIFLSVCWSMTFVFWKPKLETSAASLETDESISDGPATATSSSLPNKQHASA